MVFSLLCFAVSFFAVSFGELVHQMPQGSLLDFILFYLVSALRIFFSSESLMYTERENNESFAIGMRLLGHVE